jgi:hypothetical protein
MRARAVHLADVHELVCFLSYAVTDMYVSIACEACWMLDLKIKTKKTTKSGAGCVRENAYLSINPYSAELKGSREAAEAAAHDEGFVHNGRFHRGNRHSHRRTKQKKKKTKKKKEKETKKKKNEEEGEEEEEDKERILFIF